MYKIDYHIHTSLCKHAVGSVNDYVAYARAAAQGHTRARINLAQGVTYLATAPKSNASYVGIKQAQAEVKSSGSLPVPKHIRNAPTKLMKELDYGKGYQYAHDDPDGYLAYLRGSM